MASGQGATAVETTTTATTHRPRSHHKKSDPFNNIPQLRPVSPSPAPSERQYEEDSEPDTWWQRIVISPLLFTSFIVSLVIVERRDRAWRVSQQPSRPNSLWSRLSPWNWVDPEPYQDPDSTTWHKDHAGQESTPNPATDNPQKPIGKNDGKKKSWFYNKKHRQTAKYQIQDAWDGMKTVEVWIVGAGAIMVGGTVWGVQKIFGWAIW